MTARIATLRDGWLPQTAKQEEAVVLDPRNLTGFLRDGQFWGGEVTGR